MSENETFNEFYARFCYIDNVNLFESQGENRKVQTSLETTQLIDRPF